MTKVEHHESTTNTTVLKANNDEDFTSHRKECFNAF